MKHLKTFEKISDSDLEKRARKSLKHLVKYKPKKDAEVNEEDLDESDDDSKLKPPHFAPK